MRQFRIILTILLLLLTLTVGATGNGVEPGKAKMDRIGLYRIGIGCGVSGWSNINVTPGITFGIGSYRNIVNGEIGLKYSVLIPMGKELSILTNHQMALTMVLKVNCLRWERNCMYLGAEIDGNLNVGNLPYSCHSVAAGALLGVRLHSLDIQLRYEYDIMPRYNQKYIYETEGYDYDAAQATIFERMRAGVSLTYFFTIGL